MRAIDAAFESIRTGRAVELPTTVRGAIDAVPDSPERVGAVVG